MQRRHLYISALILLFISSGFNLQAQQWQDTLKEIQIKEHFKDTATDIRKSFAAGQQVQQIEAIYKELYQSHSLANLLSQQTPVFVKSYGVNGMATLAFRGASAAQSSVLWNGVPILNPALGVADISILSTGLFDNISLQYGSSSALYGSGNVGGALLLEQNDPSFTDSKNIGLTLGVGSFGRKDISTKASFQDKRWRVGINAFYQKAINNFKYQDALLQEHILSNAKLEAGGTLFSADYNLSKNAVSKNHSISIQLWYQQYYRQIPPALFEQLSVKEQTDISLRSLLSWHKQMPRSYFYAKASFNREYLRYRDGVVLPDNKNEVSQYYQELGWKYRLNNQGKDNQHYLLLYTPWQYAVATGQNISSKETQFRPALVVAYSYEGWGDKLKVNAALRQEWVNGIATPFLPGAGTDLGLFRLNKGHTHIELHMQANVQRTYRIPTLNELYYFPGGNANLKPEQGWNMDGGYAFLFKLSGKGTDAVSLVTFDHQVHLFNRNIKDWIYWLGGAIWTPYNIAGVHSRGMETDNKVSIGLGKVKIHAGFKYAYVLSTTVSSYLPNDGSIGKQIPYTPRYNGQANIGLSIGNLFLNYNQTYTGYRFTTVDESQFLQPYQTGNVMGIYTLPVKAYMIKVAAQVQNVWDAHYQVVNARPMPGRYFLLQLSVGL